MSGRDEARAAEYESLVVLLRHNIDVVLRTLRDSDGGPAGSPMSGLIAARTASEVITDATRVLVLDARRAGHTWAEIGQLLRISRQAAQQRFGESEAETAPRVASKLERRAVEIVEQMRSGEFEAVTVDWDETMREQLSAEQVETVWARVVRNAGPMRAVGRPTLARSGPYRIADVPIAFEHGPMRARITFNRDDTVAGLFILTPEN